MSDTCWLADFSTLQGHVARFLPPGLVAVVWGTRGLLAKDVMFQVGNYSMVGLMTYSEALGVRPLVRYYGDTSQGAGNLGTDG